MMLYELHYPVEGQESEVTIPFFYFSIAVVFLYKTYSWEKTYGSEDDLESPMWNSQTLFLGFLRKNFNCGQYVIDKHIISQGTQISDKLLSFIIYCNVF